MEKEVFMVEDGRITSTKRSFRKKFRFVRCCLWIRVLKFLVPQGGKAGFGVNTGVEGDAGYTGTL
jgi:hypothetical protein